MVRLQITLLLTWMTAVSASVGLNSQMTRPMETYSVNLNDPPRVRWNHILTNFNASVPILQRFYYDKVQILANVVVTPYSLAI